MCYPSSSACRRRDDGSARRLTSLDGKREVGGPGSLDCAIGLNLFVAQAEDFAERSTPPRQAYCMGLLRNLPCLGSNGGSSITASETGLSLTVFWNLSMQATRFAPNFSPALSTNSLCS